MTLRPAAVVLACLLVHAAPLPAQEQPSHFPTCSNDSAARTFLRRVQYLLAGGDEVRRRALGLMASPPDAARLVVEEQVCLTATFAYARLARGGRGPAPPYPVAVVRAGTQYVVQLGGLEGTETDRWEVLVFDPVFRPARGDSSP